MKSQKVAALFVEEQGVYSNLPGVDVWGTAKDARCYTGPYPVIAHPPCERWGRYWSGGPSARVRRKLGDDAGCFASALHSTRLWGGVIEHPEASHAWHTFGLLTPPKSGGWISAGDEQGWTCCVEQGHYGHAARKATWLYVFGLTFGELPVLKWGPAPQGQRLDEGFHSAEERRRAVRTVPHPRLSARQCAATPAAFRDVLLDIARWAEPR